MTILNLLLSLILSLVSIDEPKAAHDPLAAVQSDTVAATEAGPEQLAVLLARFDANSLSLITHLRPLDWTREREPLTPRGVEALVRTFESAIARDTQLNELVLRPQARALFFRDGALPSFAAVNERIYAEVFKTPAGDPWLGLANPLVFSALANDGLVAR